MSVLWQTGEPPCNVELLIEYRGDIGPRRLLGRRLRHGEYVIGGLFSKCDETLVLRWSTLDAAPDVVGRLEAFVTELHGNDDFRWVSMFWDGDDRYVVEAEGHDRGNGDDYLVKHAEAPTLAAAIEQLCGGTDGP